MEQMNSKPETLFTEEQKFTQWWMWIFILIPFSIGLWGCYQQLIVGEAFGNKPMSNLGVLLLTLFGVGFILFFYSNKLTTKVTTQGITLHFFPYTKRHHRWEEISHAEVIKYDFVGGWGVRLWTPYGTVYNVQNGKGLYVHLKNKEKFLVGTQQPEALEATILRLGKITA